MTDPEPLFEAPRPPRAWPWWTLLVLLCTLIFGIHFVEKSIPAALPDPAKIDSPILKLYGRYMMGANNLMKWAAPSQPPALTQQQDVLDTFDNAAPTIIEKLRVVPLAAELVGRDAALTRLDTIDTELAGDASLDEAFRRDAAALRAIYTDSADALEQSRRDELTARHQWFARLALSYGKPESDPDRRAFAAEATRAMSTILILFFVLLVAGIAGFALFIIAAIGIGTGRIRSAFSTPSRGTGLQPVSSAFPTSSSPPLSASNAFLESFVLFLLSFLVASGVALVVQTLTGVDITIALFCIVPVLALWPLSRGLSWDQLRAGLGWHTGRGFFTELGCGFVGYLAGIPIIVLGLVISMLIVALTGSDASHPIVNEVSSGGVLAIILLFFMTAVWAPLVEEAFFRGALYSHLRRRWAVIPAALLVGLIFAIIHPQGFAGVPVLAALGFNFCLLREWRGSLIAPMFAHAMHNGVATVALVMFLA